MRSPVFLGGALILVLALAGKLAAGWFWIGLGIAFWPLLVLAVIFGVGLLFGLCMLALIGVEVFNDAMRRRKNMAAIRARLLRRI